MRADYAVGGGDVDTPSSLVLSQREEIQRDRNVGEEIERVVGVLLVREDILYFVGICEIVSL